MNSNFRISRMNSGYKKSSINTTSSPDFIRIQPIAYVRNSINNNNIKEKKVCSNLYKVDKKTIENFKKCLNRDKEDQLHRRRALDSA